MKSQIRKQTKLLMLAAFGLCASFTASAGGLEVKSVTLPGSSWELVVKIQDQENVPNACDYYLERFEYIGALETVVVNLGQPDHCMSDNYGKRTGSFKWELPVALRMGAKLHLIVNGKKMGIMHISRNGVEFQGEPIPGASAASASGTAPID